MIEALVALFVHVDVVEVLWLAIAAVGLLLVVDELFVARADCRLLLLEHDAMRRRDRRDHDREFMLERELVGGDVIAAWWLIAFQAANLAVGVLAALTPQPTTGRTLTGWAIIALLLSAAAAVPARSYGRRRRRRRLTK